MRAQHVLVAVGTLLFVGGITIAMVGPNLVATTPGPSTPADDPTAMQTPSDTAPAWNENDQTGTDDSGDGDLADEKESDEEADDEADDEWDEKNGRGPPDDGDPPGKGKGHR